MIRLLDEVLPIGERGVLLFTEHGNENLTAGCCLRDARGKTHRVTRVEPQEDLFTLLIEGGSLDYFQRLFRDVRVDATAFDIDRE